jgi:hypothetical protein
MKKLIDSISNKAQLLLAAAICLAIFVPLPVRANAAELVVVGRDNCPYCRAWELEVGKIYGKTAEARFAPLRRIDISDISRAPYSFREPVRYTPTFILVDRNREIGRIVGYSDQAMFWGSLHELLARLAPAPSEGPAMERIARRVYR